MKRVSADDSSGLSGAKISQGQHFLNQITMSEDFSRFHPVWNVSKENVDLFRMATEVFAEEKFGNLAINVIGSEEDKVVAISLEREGAGEPAVFAEVLAYIGYLAQVKEGLTEEKEIRQRMVEGAEKLRTDQEFRQQVAGRSLAATAKKLEGVINKVKFEAGLLNSSDEARLNLTVKELRRIIS